MRKQAVAILSCAFVISYFVRSYIRANFIINCLKNAFLSALAKDILRYVSHQETCILKIILGNDVNLVTIIDLNSTINTHSIKHSLLDAYLFTFMTVRTHHYLIKQELRWPDKVGIRYMIYETMFIQSTSHARGYYPIIYGAISLY